jgi:CspA family cold shock protein|tara:strand:- start:430 stop:639 length:210 start_codon:yes stop_codon:yes gene_type:complete
MITNTGKIKWFNATKGYGFIESPETDGDVFLHISALQESGIDSITEGDAVTFDLGDNRGKVTAINVKKA